MPQYSYLFSSSFVFHLGCPKVFLGSYCQNSMRQGWRLRPLSWLLTKLRMSFNVKGIRRLGVLTEHAQMWVSVGVGTRERSDRLT